MWVATKPFEVRVRAAGLSGLSPTHFNLQLPSIAVNFQSFCQDYQIDAIGGLHQEATRICLILLDASPFDAKQPKGQGTWDTLQISETTFRWQSATSLSWPNQLSRECSVTRVSGTSPTSMSCRTMEVHAIRRLPHYWDSIQTIRARGAPLDKVKSMVNKRWCESTEHWTALTGAQQRRETCGRWHAEQMLWRNPSFKFPVGHLDSATHCLGSKREEKHPQSHSPKRLSPLEQSAKTSSCPLPPFSRVGISGALDYPRISWMQDLFESQFPHLALALPSSPAGTATPLHLLHTLQLMTGIACKGDFGWNEPTCCGE